MAAVESKQLDPVVARLRGVAKQYQRGNEVVPVLEKLDLDLPRGDFVALMGPSGSGKTTLLNLLGGLDRPSTGTIEVDGLAIDRLSNSKLGDWRADNVGFVFQMYNLLPVLTAERNVELPLLLTKLGRADRLKRVHTALDARGARRSHQAQAARTVGRPGAARGHRARHRHRSRRCCCATSPRVTSIASRATRSSICCRRSTNNTARPSSW